MDTTIWSARIEQWMVRNLSDSQIDALIDALEDAVTNICSDFGIYGDDSDGPGDPDGGPRDPKPLDSSDPDEKVVR